MPSDKIKRWRLSVVIVLICLCLDTKAKLSDNRTNEDSEEEVIPHFKKFQHEGPALMFADDFKQTLERYLFGICPQSFKMPLAAKKNGTAVTCDLDSEQQDLAGRLATLALRAHTATRSDCARLGAALANTLGELARTAANRQANGYHHQILMMVSWKNPDLMTMGSLYFPAAASKEEAKKRKLSKSQKAKIQAKQRTALAVKKKAAALAAAAAAKVAA